MLLLSIAGKDALSEPWRRSRDGTHAAPESVAAREMGAGRRAARQRKRRGRPAAAARRCPKRAMAASGIHARAVSRRIRGLLSQSRLAATLCVRQLAG